MRKHTLLSVTAATILAGLALTGCTAAESDGSATASASGAASAADSVAKPANGVADATGKCVDGRSTPVRDGKKITVADCDLVDVMGSKNTITAGSVKHLVIEGDGNTVTVSAATEVTTIGKGNTVTYSGHEPTFNERGTGNTVQPKGTKQRLKR